MQGKARNHSSRRFRSEKGLTLVEVAIAAFVMLFGISTSIIVVQSGFHATDTSRNLTLAAQIMQSEMERLRLLNWDSLPSTESDVDLSTFFEDNPVLEDRFTLTRTVSDVSGREGEMKTIHLLVQWTGINGMAYSRRFVTRYTKDGLYDYYYTIAR